MRVINQRNAFAYIRLLTINILWSRIKYQYKKNFISVLRNQKCLQEISLVSI